MGGESETHDAPSPQFQLEFREAVVEAVSEPTRGRGAEAPVPLTSEPKKFAEPGIRQSVWIHRLRRNTAVLDDRLDEHLRGQTRDHLGHVEQRRRDRTHAAAAGEWGEGIQGFLEKG